MSSLVFSRHESGYIKISSDIVKQINLFRQIGSDDLESGGVLLGRFIKGSNDIVVDKITTPMAGDIQRRCYFYRKPKSHQLIIDKEWELSEGTCNYLGEWHTHPQTIPFPSEIDTSDWKRKMKTDVLPDTHLFFVIQGTKKLRIWEGNIHSLEVYNLKRVN